jgi:hypothetical protein
VTALWTVTALVAILAVVESVVVIALIRQVGLLHLRTGSHPEPQPPHGQQPARGPQPGSRLQLNPARDVLGTDPAPDLLLLGFVRPTCGHCTKALPAFISAASGLSGNQRALLVSDGDYAGTRAYLAAHDVALPLVTGPHLLSANGIPAIPYAVVTDSAGIVLAAGTATDAEQLESVLGRAQRDGSQ